MAWRGLHVTKPARLALSDRQIVVEQADGTARLPLEDIASVIIDTPQATLTAALVSACMDHGVAVIVSDATHTPSGVMLPFHRHHRQAHVAGLQAEAGLPLRKRMWQAIIQAKIGNQAAVLDAYGAGSAPLRAMADLVGSGDPDNVEARAARAYWQCLFPEFVRDRAQDRRNKLLNYGYAVVRSAVARSLVGAGLLPAFGLHHDSAANPFNLADDIVEPFRPFVDALVWRLSDNGVRREGDLAVEDRRALAGLPFVEARAGRDTVTLLVAADRAAESLVAALEGRSAALLVLPAMPRPAA